jgi:hypothetical protein
MGHAFAGLATAVIARPSRDSSARLAFWVPVIVALAYLPDIAAQVMSAAGLEACGPVCHSIVLAAPAALAVAALLRWLLHVRWRPGVTVALVSIALHDLFDVLVGHRRLLWWPISGRPVSFASGEAGLSMTSEVLVFGGSLLALLMVRWIWHLRSDRSRQESERIAVQGSRPWQRVWVTGGITALLLLAVAATQYLRDVRERQLDLAWTMISRKQGASALDLLD